MYTFTEIVLILTDLTICSYLCRYIDQPVRRHIQDENTPRMGALTKEVSFAGSCQSTARSLQSDSMQFAKKKKKEKVNKISLIFLYLVIFY